MRPTRRAFAAFAALLVAPTLGIGSGERPPSGAGFVCGTGARRELAALVRDAYHASRVRTRPATRAPDAGAARAAAPVDAGDVATLEDDGTILPEVNLFDLAGRSFRFEPATRSSYRIAATRTPFDPSGGTPIPLGDDDAVRIDLRFLFTFYGTDYTSVWLNSDGNLTFAASDTETSDRDLARFASGRPRIGPFFADLDPTSGGVGVRRDSDGVVFIWNGVPAFEKLDANSFSVKLFKTTGAIEFVYGARVDETSAVVGISPGEDQGEIRAVDFSSAPGDDPLAGTIVELFSGETQLSETALARMFYRGHPDRFDHLVVFLGFGFDLGAYAYEINVRNEVRGIGLTSSDNSARYGSSGRLRSFVMMGSLDGPNRYPVDPKQLYLGTNSTLGILGQEVGHRWLAFAPFRDGGVNSKTILGRQSAHWSFFFDSDGSVMEGNDIDDRGPEQGNQRFITVGATRTYSLLDRYMMGLAESDEVPAAFVVESPTATARSASASPTLGVVFGGTRKDVTIDSIVAANGPRTPPAPQAPKVVRQAFLLVTRRGQKATAQQIAKVQAIRDAWVDFFHEATGERGWIVTDLADRPSSTAARFYFPVLRGGDGRSTGIALVNYGGSPADVLLEQLDDSGERGAAAGASINPRMITLAPGEQIAMLADEIYRLQSGRGIDGWGRAESTSSQVAAQFIEGADALDALDGARASGSTARRLFLTRAGPGGLVQPGAANRIALVNPGARSARIDLELVGEDGRVEAAAERTLRPGGRLAEESETLFPSARRGAYVRASSTVPIAGYQSLQTGAALAGLEAREAPAENAAKLYGAHFVSGSSGGTRYGTDVNLVNTSAGSRTVELELVGAIGGGIRNPVVVEIPAGGAYRARGDVLFGLGDPLEASPLVEASLEVRADGGGILGDLLIGDAESGRFLAACPLEPSSATDIVFAHLAQGDGGGGRSYFTGIALFNPNGADTVVTLDVYSQAGVKTASATIPLAARERISRTVAELAPAAAGELRGYVRARSSAGPIVALELVGDTALRFLAAVVPQSIARD